MKRIKETLEEEEATEFGVTLSAASSPDDITTLVLLLSKHPLPVSHGLKFASLKRQMSK